MLETSLKFRLLRIISDTYHGSRKNTCIPIYIQQDATLRSLFISGNCSTYFGWYHHPKHVEKFSDINKLCKVAFCWIYIGLYLRRTDP